MRPEPGAAAPDPDAEPAPGAVDSDTDETPAPVVVPLLVRYPPSYPWFPPEIQDLTLRLQLPRHAQPVTGNLCLVHRRDWRMTTTAAELLTEQMPRMLAAATAPTPPPAGAEVPAPEPVGNSLTRCAGSVFVDSAVQVPPEHRKVPCWSGSPGSPTAAPAPAS